MSVGSRFVLSRVAEIVYRRLAYRPAPLLRFFVLRLHCTLYECRVKCSHNLL
jgi:hypothetical protein